MTWLSTLQKSDLIAVIEAILLNAPCLIVGMTPDNAVCLWSQSVATLTGWSAEEVIGRNLTELLIPPANHKVMRATFEDAKEGGQQQINYLLKKNGDKILVFGRSVAVGQGGIIFLILVTGFDMGRFKLAKGDLA